MTSNDNDIAEQMIESTMLQRDFILPDTSRLLPVMYSCRERWKRIRPSVLQALTQLSHSVVGDEAATILKKFNFRCAEAVEAVVPSRVPRLSPGSPSTQAKPLTGSSQVVRQPSLVGVDHTPQVANETFENPKSCPKCGSTSTSISPSYADAESRHNKDSFTKSVRTCHSCGNYFETNPQPRSEDVIERLISRAMEARTISNPTHFYNPRGEMMDIAGEYGFGAPNSSGVHSHHNNTHSLRINPHDPSGVWKLSVKTSGDESPRPVSGVGPESLEAELKNRNLRRKVESVGVNWTESQFRQYLTVAENRYKQGKCIACGVNEAMSLYSPGQISRARYGDDTTRNPLAVMFNHQPNPSEALSGEKPKDMKGDNQDKTGPTDPKGHKQEESFADGFCSNCANLMGLPGLEQPQPLKALTYYEGPVAGQVHEDVVESLIDSYNQNGFAVVTELHVDPVIRDLQGGRGRLAGKSSSDVMKHFGWSQDGDIWTHPKMKVPWSHQSDVEPMEPHELHSALTRKHFPEAINRATGLPATSCPTDEEMNAILGEDTIFEFEPNLRHLKGKPGINPYAIAWSMKNKGYKSHKNADGSPKNESLSDRWCPECGETEEQVKRVYDEPPAVHPDHPHAKLDFHHEGTAWYGKSVDDIPPIKLGHKDVPYLQTDHVCGNKWVSE